MNELFRSAELTQTYPAPRFELWRQASSFSEDHCPIGCNLSSRAGLKSAETPPTDFIITWLLTIYHDKLINYKS